MHASILPKYRGAAPIQWAVINGDSKTGVTTMQMDEGMDTGDILICEKVDIDKNETTGELWDRLSVIGGKVLVKTLNKIKDGTITRTKQGDNYTMAPMLNKELSKINWQEKTSLEIKNLTRGLNPIMGTYSFLDGKKYKFWSVEIAEENSFENTNEEAGTILISNEKQGLYVKTKDGALKINIIQPENSKRMNVCDFLRGNKLEVGKKFE